MQLVVDRSLQELWRGEAVLAVCMIRGLQNVGRLASGFDQEVSHLLSDLRQKGKAVLEEFRMQRMRAACRSMPDMDPTRYRPASESLIRRFQDKGFFRINPLVDVNNLLSARLRVPLGIYDLNRVAPTAWSYRIGFSGEKYLTFTNQEKSADGKLVLADATGVFGSPVADSGRGAISADTKDVAVVGFLPFEILHAEADEIAADIERTFAHHFSPAVIERQVVLREG